MNAQVNEKKASQREITIDNLTKRIDSGLVYLLRNLTNLIFHALVEFMVLYSISIIDIDVLWQTLIYLKRVNYFLHAISPH